MTTDRKCKGCDKKITGHPNKRFCKQKCKDRYHNTHNPRGYQAAHYVHPFSSEAFEP